MKLERTKNAARNLLFGTGLQVYKLVVPFLMRSAILYGLGVEYLGLNGLFTSVLQLLNLAELGVGAAMVYSMYRPIAEDDAQRICALLGLYCRYYRIIGAVVLALGLLLLPWLPWLIRGDVPADSNIYVLYLLNLAATVLSYWLFAYRNSIFQAHQRTDVISKVTVATDTLKYGLQVAAILLFRSYYGYVVAILLSQLVNNLLIAVAAGKYYPNYRASGSLSRQETTRVNHRIRDLVTAKLGSVIVHSSDTVVVSAFLGLEVLAIYQNYYYLITAVAGILAIGFRSILAGVGNSIIVDSKEKVTSDFKTVLFATAWITGFGCCCFLCLYQTFIAWWVGETLLLEFPLVICLVVFYFVYEINHLLNHYKDAAGMWKKDRLRPLVTAGTNLILNLILVQVIGLYGIVLSTVISTAVVGMPWLIHNLFKEVFAPQAIKGFLGRLLSYVCVTFTACCMCWSCCRWITLEGILGIFLRMGVCFVVGNAILWLVYHRFAEYRKCLGLLDRLTGKKIGFLHIMACKGESEGASK